MFELRLLCPQEQVEVLSEALDALDALSVSVEDADAHTPAEAALFGEPDMPPPAAGWNRSRITALFTAQDAAVYAQTVLQVQDFAAECADWQVRAVEDQDWVRLTQSQFAPVEITPTFWVVPSWHEAPPEAKRIIRLDPGLAFGTGTHPTTQMCLRWIAEHDFTNERVLDYGCGSGILAIAAGQHGAPEVDAVDIDPAAVSSTQANAQANGVQLQAGLPEAAQGRYHVVLANILASPLKVLAPLLCSLSQGQLVLAGILARQADELKAAYAPYCQLEVRDEQDGWILMHAQIRP